jgi:serine/threonine-protein kinase
MGAIPYMAPEAIESPATVNTPADIWSIGAMMYELLTGDKPFGNGLQAVHKIIEAKLPIIPPFVINNTQFSALSKEIVTIIFLCLQKDTNARPNADELVEYCAKFCYPTSERYIGIVKNIQHSAWGFISHDDYAEVFFHLDSVYGEKPSIGSKVWFSKFVGEPYWRAHPVICLK